MVVRKQLKDKKKEKPVSDEHKSRKPDPRWNVNALPDAIQDGKFLAKVGDEVIVVRLRDGKMQKSVCIVKEIEGEKISTFDDTRGQWFSFTTVGLEKYGIQVKIPIKNVQPPE